MAQVVYATRALHQKVLVLLIVDTFDSTYFGVILPVDGQNHQKESQEWAHVGMRLPHNITASVFGASVAQLEAEGSVAR